MGEKTSSRDVYDATVRQLVQAGQAATARGEEQVRTTGKLNKLVDPAEYGVIRESRIRLTERSDGLFEVAVGAPVPIEYRLDTTGSMRDNVDRALRALPNLCEAVEWVLRGRDPFYCASIFGDLEDPRGAGTGYPLNRGQFECLSDRMVNQLTLMNPERGGCGNGGEDPHYGLFASAYLSSFWLRRAGLKSYDFTITDEPVHPGIEAHQLIRIFGEEVFEKLRANGHEFSARKLPSNEEICADLLKVAHPFVLIVDGWGAGTKSCWRDLLGRERMIVLPSIEVVSDVMATVIGLTEGTLTLENAADFLVGRELKKDEARRIVDAVAHIPLGAQCQLPNFARLPKKGDLYAKKTDLWPIDPSELPKGAAKKTGKKAKPEPDEESGEGWI